MLQLGFEYDPAPPFDAGSPAAASAALVEAYQARMEALARPECAFRGSRAALAEDRQWIDVGLPHKA